MELKGLSTLGVGMLQLMLSLRSMGTCEKQNYCSQNQNAQKQTAMCTVWMWTQGIN